MRGKKVDTEFVSDFISSCVSRNIISSEAICKIAKSEIQKIDLKIKEVEELKKRRSKLKDVLINLDNSKIDKSKDKEILSFYGISNLHLANKFATYIQYNNLNILEISMADRPILKELLSINVLEEIDKKIIIGNKFQEFICFYNLNYTR